MRERTLRTIGASVVLAGVVVAAITQLPTDADPSAISLVAPESSTTTGVIDPGDSTSTHDESFVYRLGVLSSISTDNFWAFYGDDPSVWNAYVLGPTKPALFALDPSDGSIQPELATNIPDAQSDATGWFVQVPMTGTHTWSDGTPITAHDLIFTFDTARELGLGGSWSDVFPGAVREIRAVSDYEVRIDFASRPSLSVWPHAIGTAPLMPAHVWQPLLDGITAEDLYAYDGSWDVGGGPLVLSEASEDVAISHSNPGYPGNHAPDVVEYHVYADEMEAVEALQRGEIDSILTPRGLTSEQVAAFAGDANISISTSPANGVRYLGFNLEREPMANLAFRTALALMLDREGIGQGIGTGGLVANSFVSAENELWFVAEAAAANASRFTGEIGPRLEAAIEGLRGAGYSWVEEPGVDGSGTVLPGAGLTINGIPQTPLTILTPGDAYDPSRPRYAAEIAATLEWLGFEVRVVETDFQSVVDLTFTRGEDGLLNYDMYLLGWTLGNPSLPGYYRTLFSPNGEMNNTGYSSQVFTHQLDAYESSYTLDSARKQLWSMEATLAFDLPYLLLYSTEITEAFRSDRVSFGLSSSLGGLQGRSGGINDVRPVS